MLKALLEELIYSLNGIPQAEAAQNAAKEASATLEEKIAKAEEAKQATDPKINVLVKDNALLMRMLSVCPRSFPFLAELSQHHTD